MDVEIALETVRGLQVLLRGLDVRDFVWGQDLHDLFGPKRVFSAETAGQSATLRLVHSGFNYFGVAAGVFGGLHRGFVGLLGQGMARHHQLKVLSAHADRATFRFFAGDWLRGRGLLDHLGDATNPQHISFIHSRLPHQVDHLLLANRSVGDEILGIRALMGRR